VYAVAIEEPTQSPCWPGHCTEFTEVYRINGASRGGYGCWDKAAHIGEDMETPDERLAEGDGGLPLPPVNGASRKGATLF